MPDKSGKLLVRLQTSDIAIFRFLLEAYENLAIFTVLERNPALLKVIFAPESRSSVLKALKETGRAIKLEIEEWPTNIKGKQ